MVAADYTAEDRVDLYDHWMILVWWRLICIGGCWLLLRLGRSVCTVDDPGLMEVDLHWWLLVLASDSSL